MLLLYVQLCARLCQGEKTLFCPLDVYRLVGQQNQPVRSRRKQVHTPLPFTMTGQRGQEEGHSVCLGVQGRLLGKGGLDLGFGQQGGLGQTEV